MDYATVRNIATELAAIDRAELRLLADSEVMIEEKMKWFKRMSRLVPFGHTERLSAIRHMQLKVERDELLLALSQRRKVLEGEFEKAKLAVIC